MKPPQRPGTGRSFLTLLFLRTTFPGLTLHVHVRFSFGVAGGLDSALTPARTFVSVCLTFHFISFHCTFLFFSSLLCRSFQVLEWITSVYSQWAKNIWMGTVVCHSPRRCSLPLRPRLGELTSARVNYHLSSPSNICPVVFAVAILSIASVP